MGCTNSADYLKEIERLQQRVDELENQNRLSNNDDQVVNEEHYRLIDQTSNQQLMATLQQIRASNQQLTATEQQLRASNQQLMATEQQLRASNQQLKAANQQLKATTEMLRQSEELHRATFEQAAVGIARVGNDGKWLEINQKLCDIVGYNRDELLLKTFQDITHPDDIDADLAFFNQMLDDKIQTYGMEKRYFRKDGSIVWINLTVGCIRKSDRSIHYFISVIEDITSRKKAESELVRLSEAIDQAAEGIVITDSHAKISYANPAFQKITGYCLDEIIGQTPQILSSGKHGISFYRDLWDTVLAGSRWNGRIINKRKSGKLYTAECSISPVKDSVGHISHFVWITNDISEKIDFEEKLIQSQKMEAIGTLAGGIAHDFNNILTSIIGFTELALDETEKNSSLEQSLQEVYSAGRRAKELVKQILAFARKSEEQVKPIKLRAIIEQITPLLRSSIPTSIEITTEFDSDGFIMGNPTQLHQVIMNLCSNAAQAMEDEGGQLTLSTKDVDFDQLPMKIQLQTHDQRFVQIQVSDTGTGISPDHIDSIFDPYFTTKSTGEGTGLGLAMVQGIVESYGGHIMVDSRLNEGTTFMVYLPLTYQTSIQYENEPDTLPTGSERILLVDDEAVIAKMCSLMLESLCYTVSSRVSSTDALELFKARSADFDLVITDMTMPDMTGDTLAIEMMKIRDDIPVILCTGYSKRLSDETCYSLGIKALIHKPFVRADLAKTVRKVLDENKTI